MPKKSRYTSGTKHKAYRLTPQAIEAIARTAEAFDLSGADLLNLLFAQPPQLLLFLVGALVLPEAVKSQTKNVQE